MTPLVVLVGLVLGVAVAALVLAALLAAWVWHVHRVVTAAADLAEACDRDRDLALAEGRLIAVQRALDGEPLGPDDPDGGEPMPRPAARVVPLRPHGGSAA